MTTSAQEEQKLRKALAGSTTATTFFHKALAELQLEQGQSGRFTDKASVVGATRVPLYPRQPADSPWSGDISGVEPSLGWSVEDQAPVGEPFEIAASSALSPEDAAEAATASLSIPSHGAPAPPTVFPFPVLQTSPMAPPS